MRALIGLCLISLSAASLPAYAQRAPAPTVRRSPAGAPAQPAAAAAPAPANRAVYLDSAGVVRWRDDRTRGRALRRELRAAHRLRLPRRRLRPRRPQEDDRRGHGAVRPHGLGRPAAHLLGRLGGRRQRRQPDRQRPSRPAGLPHRPGAGARHLHALQPDPALQLELARRDGAGHRDAGLRPASSARSGWAPTPPPSRRRSTTCARS